MVMVPKCIMCKFVKGYYVLSHYLNLHFKEIEMMCSERSCLKLFCNIYFDFYNYHIIKKLHSLGLQLKEIDQIS